MVLSIHLFSTSHRAVYVFSHQHGLNFQRSSLHIVVPVHGTLAGLHAASTSACQWIENIHRTHSFIPSRNSSHIWGWVCGPAENSKLSGKSPEPPASTASRDAGQRVDWQDGDVSTGVWGFSDCFLTYESINVPCVSRGMVFEASYPRVNVDPAGRVEVDGRLSAEASGAADRWDAEKDVVV